MPNVTCAVVGCTHNYGNTPGLIMYAFRTKPWEQERTNKWITFTKRGMVNGQPWQPSKNSKICSIHFKGGCKSEDPRSSSYNPTIYTQPPTPKGKKTNSGKENKSHQMNNHAKYGSQSICDCLDKTPQSNPAQPTNSNTSSFPYQTIIQTKCITCDQDMEILMKQDLQQSFLFHDIVNIFSKHLKFKPEHKKQVEELWKYRCDFNSIPFCSSCVETVKNLFELDRQFESVKHQIHHEFGKMYKSLINVQDDDEEAEEQVEKETVPARKSLRKNAAKQPKPKPIKKRTAPARNFTVLRKAIRKNFKPRVNLTRCKTPVSMQFLNNYNDDDNNGADMMDDEDVKVKEEENSDEDFDEEAQANLVKIVNFSSILEEDTNRNDEAALQNIPSSSPSPFPSTLNVLENSNADAFVTNEASTYLAPTQTIATVPALRFRFRKTPDGQLICDLCNEPINSNSQQEMLHHVKTFHKEASSSSSSLSVSAPRVPAQVIQEQVQPPIQSQPKSKNFPEDIFTGSQKCPNPYCDEWLENDKSFFKHVYMDICKLTEENGILKYKGKWAFDIISPMKETLLYKPPFRLILDTYKCQTCGVVEEDLKGAKRHGECHESVEKQARLLNNDQGPSPNMPYGVEQFLASTSASSSARLLARKRGNDQEDELNSGQVYKKRKTNPV